MPDLKQSAVRMFRETLAGIDIPLSMRRKLCRAASHILVNGERVDLAAFDRICVIAIGKASLAMARGLADVLALPAGLQFGDGLGLTIYVALAGLLYWIASRREN